MRILRDTRRTVRETLLACGAAAALVATALVVGLGTPAYACTCAQVDLGTQAKQADAVFVGTPVKESEDGDSRVYEVRVSDVYEGTADPVTTVRTAADDAACGVDLEIDQQYMFVGEQAEPHGEVSTGMCSGTKEISDQVIAAVEKALGPATPYRGNGNGGDGRDNGNNTNNNDDNQSSGDNQSTGPTDSGTDDENAADDTDRASDSSQDGNSATYATVGIVLALGIGASFLLPKLRRRNRKARGD